MENLKTIKTSDDEYFDNELNKEPILDESNSRFCVYPIVYQNLWNSYKKQQSAFWKAEEIDFSQDYKDWLNLNEDEQYVIKMILAFFANTDGIVNLNIGSTFLNEITINEAKVAYTYQMMMENIHSESYSLMLDNLIRDKTEKKFLFDAIKTIPSIKKISDWALKWIGSNTHISKRIVAFACVEGIFFSGAFATIFWLKKYKGSGKLFMPGLIKSNEFIARDEGMHCEFAYLLYSKIVNKLDEKIVKQMIKESVDIEKEFIIESLPCKLIGMNSLLMSQYIEFMADRLLLNLGYTKLYNVINHILN
jgi:ribonucleotide reductase beta subunit family protein with ferritin-like domain